MTLGDMGGGGSKNSKKGGTSFVNGPIFVKTVLDFVIFWGVQGKVTLGDMGGGGGQQKVTSFLGGSAKSALG